MKYRIKKKDLVSGKITHGSYFDPYHLDYLKQFILYSNAKSKGDYHYSLDSKI